MSAWAVTATGGYKRIHRAGCRHARHPYKWADGMTGNELIDRLVVDGAIMWHTGCLVCCPALDAAIQAEQNIHTAGVIKRHLGLTDDARLSSADATRTASEAES